MAASRGVHPDVKGRESLILSHCNRRKQMQNVPSLAPGGSQPGPIQVAPVPIKLDKSKLGRVYYYIDRAIDHYRAQIATSGSISDL